MAPTSTSLTSKVASGSPYQLDRSQTKKASSALLKHIKSEEKRTESESTKKNLLANDDDSSDEVDDSEDTPIWLVLTTKKHIVDKKRLKPGKISMPHSLNTSPNSTICLITADPQRSFKDVVAHDSFPKPLASRIGRVIGISKLKAKYKSYESRRQLLSEYDIFLADDRIVTLLPNLLGKIFFKGGSKRPVPVNLSAPKKAQDKSTPKNGDEGKSIASPKAMAEEIERALSAALVHLSPSVTTSVRVGKASWGPEKVAANVEAVVNGLTEKFVTKGWRNVRSVHIKGPNTMALPIWLADELWVDEGDVLEDAPAENEALEGKDEVKKIADAPAEAASSKRKAREGEEEQRPKKAKKADKAEGDDLAKEIALRKEKLKKQKAQAAAETEGDSVVSKVSKEVPLADGGKAKIKAKKTKTVKSA
ncbi:ribosomal protein L1 [Xylona heveae TC161]|uniref:Ribosomal protein L1 n=1 Tax=Xylona heveae (strain CBS 132557 / TC161) TaxID=1328760 RepID=A0A161TC81_XYLHT|nr:ribosomal protein L1 [Xylona heveae TC161]KZF23367.1 ribosomal protein L1 [Xylona heveae TC161]